MTWFRSRHVASGCSKEKESLRVFWWVEWFSRGDAGGAERITLLLSIGIA
jgi:hypothetical protein